MNVKKILFITISCLIISQLSAQRNTGISSQRVNLEASKSQNVSTKLVYNKNVSSNNRSANSGAEGFCIQIPPQEALIFQYRNNEKQLIHYQFPTYQTLTSNAKLAIAKSPKWLRNDLRTLMVQLGAEFQDKWANTILEAESPYIDEIAFSISAMSPEYLESSYAYAEMFNINAEYIYKYDTLFKYVELKEYNTGTEDYYTTTSYKMLDANGDTAYYEIPKEIYYWYVVHPQISDEIPGFVKTYMHEVTHTDVMATPENGKFWRAYMFEHNNPSIPRMNYGVDQSSVDADLSAIVNNIPETEYKAMALNMLDSLQACSLYWDGQALSEYDAESTYLMLPSYYVDNALALINRYLWSTMRFWSISAVERPHQPVRIINWGMGRCGEHEDLTAAMGRAALLPVAGVEGLSADHVWNTFYDPSTNTKDVNYDMSKWKVWETTITGFVNAYVNHDADGNRWASLNLMRSDGYTNCIVDQYSNQTATIEIYVKDDNQNPVDGAHVTLAAKSASTDDIYLDVSGTTDQNGFVSFTVGNGRVYYAKVIGEGHEVPEGMSVTGVTNNQETQDGEVYVNNITLSGYTKSILSKTNVEDSNIDPNGYEIQFDFNIDNEFVFGKNMSNDLVLETFYGSKTREHRATDNKLNFFQCDLENILKYMNQDDASFSAFNDTIIKQNFSHNSVLTDNDIYYVIYNDNINNYMQISGNVSLINPNNEEVTILDVDVEGGELFTEVSVKEIENTLELFAYPNPSNGIVYINSTNKIEHARIYDITGRVIIAEQELLEQINSNSSVNISKQKPGVYFLFLENERTNKTIKFILN